MSVTVYLAAAAAAVAVAVIAVAVGVMTGVAKGIMVVTRLACGKCVVIVVAIGALDTVGGI